MTISLYKSEDRGSGSFSAKPLASNYGNVGQLVEPFKCLTDGVCGDALEVFRQITAGTAYAPGQPHPLRTGWVISKIAPRFVATEDNNFWLVDITSEPDPLLIPDEVQFQAASYMEVVYKDQKTDKVFANTADAPFDKGFEERKGRGRLEITRNLPELKILGAQLELAVLFHKNQTAVRFFWRENWWSYYPETLYCVDIKCPFIWEPKPHYRLTTVFEVDPKKWIRHPLNQGKDEKTASGGFAHMTDDKGRLTGSYYPLGTDGKKLKPGYPLIFLDCDTIPSADFNWYPLFPGT